MILRANFHTHTDFCDGKNSPEEMLLAAINLGFTHLGFSGHMDADIHMDFASYKREIHRLREKYSGQIQILCGVELDNLYELDDLDARKNLDYVIGSTHFLNVQYTRPLSVDNTPEDLQLLCDEFFSGDFYKLVRAYYELEAQIFTRTNCDFVGHFDLLTKFNHGNIFFNENDSRYRNSALDALEIIAHQGIMFEINTHNSRIMPAAFILKRLRELNGEIIINSDAHSTTQLNAKFPEAVELARTCGFDHTNILELHDNELITRQIAL